MTQVRERTHYHDRNSQYFPPSYETLCLFPDSTAVENLIREGSNEEIVQAYGLPMSYTRAVDEMRERRIVGSEAQGWWNIAHHNFVSGKIFGVLSFLTGQDHITTQVAGYLAVTHDKDKRNEVEQGAAECVNCSGLDRVRYNLKRQLAIESSKTGLEKGTGIDFRGYEDWDLLTLAMRWTDSHVGPTIEGFAPDGKVLMSIDHLIPWSKRRMYLEQMKSDLNNVAGEELYGGVPAFTICDAATLWADQQILKQAQLAHPQLFYQYSSGQEPSLYDYVEGVLQGRIWTPSLQQYLL